MLDPELGEALTNAPAGAAQEPLTAAKLEEALKLFNQEHMTGRTIAHVVSKRAWDRIQKDDDSIGARMKEKCLVCGCLPIAFCKLEVCTCDDPDSHKTPAARC